jgi:LacI family transcriptional regulator
MDAWQGISPRPGRSNGGRRSGTLGRRRVPQVALLLETSTGYGRGLLHGILRYSRLHGPWSLHVAPGHLRQVLPKPSSWHGDGIIARVGSPAAERLIRLAGVPCVMSSLGEPRSFQGRDRVGEIRTDSEAIGRLCAGHLLEAGFRRFAFCGFMNCSWSAAREKAFVQFARERGFDCSTHRITLASWMHRPNWIQRRQHEQPLMIRWLRSLPKPVGLMACNDVCGLELLEACAAAELRVPDDVAVVGVDNDEMMCELANPPLSSVALDVENSGYEAARLLDSLMAGNVVSRRVVLVKPTHVAVRLSSDVIAQEDRVVAHALQFIRDHSRRNLSVTDVCEEVGVSRRTLERRFFRSVGRTILAEITRCHLDRARQLLLETDLPCGQVAFESGFASSNTFNRAFVRSEGTTPRNFRWNANPKVKDRRPNLSRSRARHAQPALSADGEAPAVSTASPRSENDALLGSGRPKGR